MFRLPVAAPFDFEMSLRFVCSPPLAAAHLDCAPVADHWCGREYRRVLALPSRPVLVRVQNQGTIDRPALEVRTHPAALTAAERVLVFDRLAHVLSASVRLAEFYRQVARDPVLRVLSERFHGVKIIRAPALYESLLAAILEQQLNFRFAAAVKRRLLTAYGPPLEFDGRAYFGFPSPARLAQLLPSDLRPLQISARKASYLIAVAQAAASAQLDDRLWSALPPAAAFERLVSLRGVGRWTAEYALLRGLGHADALPADDVGLQKTVASLYGLGAFASAAAIRRRWRSLAPWRGYATYYVWFTQWCAV